MADKKKKPVAALIIEMAKGGKKASKPEAEPDDKVMLAEEILEAVKKDDADMLLVALKDLIYTCMMEHEEGED